ncbi:hypothetical protein NQ315_001033 [Exocentrus adspersus]|uniref:Uncharacterized protein n=1 Tax=Exocentrus adspersus TaxID=1586481 RepID=A0AAV8WE62_9CUCU|nr:hypothetical protein NQ315_001033 [Exocentrus adspersus]
MESKLLVSVNIISDAEARKIHGYITDSDSDSGKSQFDELYYKYKPPPVPINHSRIITVHAPETASQNDTDTSPNLPSRVISTPPATVPGNPFRGNRMVGITRVVKDSEVVPHTYQFNAWSPQTPAVPVSGSTSTSKENRDVGNTRAVKDPEVVHNAYRFDAWSPQVKTPAVPVPGGSRRENKDVGNAWVVKDTKSILPNVAKTTVVSTPRRTPREINVGVNRPTGNNGYNSMNHNIRNIGEGNRMFTPPPSVVPVTAPVVTVPGAPARRNENHAEDSEDNCCWQLQHTEVLN